MIGWFAASMIGASALMVVILGIRRKVAEWFGAEWAYALWLLPLLRMVLPPLPQGISSAPPVLILLPSDPVASTLSAAPAPATFDWVGLVFAVWLGGAALFLCWQQSAYGAFLLHLGPDGKKGTPPEFGGIKVIESTAVDGPVAVGFFCRRIVVPIDFTVRYSKAEQRLALEHELIHHRRLDLVWNFLALLMLALNWFNPIAHVAFRAFRADQELSCDALVTRRAPGERRDYALALVKSASSGGLIAAAPLNHAAFLKRRLKMMNMHRSGRARALGGAVAFLFTGGAALLVGSAGAARAPQPTDGALVVAAPGNAPVVVDARKVEGLTDTCQHLDGQNRVIICRDSALQEHPDIRAAVDRAVREAASEAAATRPEDMAEVRRAIRHAHEALDDPEVRRQLARAGHVAADADAIAARAVASAERVRAVAVRDALEQARVQLANTDWKETKLAALRSVEESLRASRVGLDEDQREAIEDALREAREQIQGIDFSEDIRAAQEDLTQALEDSGTDE